MSAPQYKDVGATVSGVGAIVVAWPAVHAVDDIGLLFVETANQASTPPPSGWIELTNIGIGTGGAADATRLTVFWRRATSTAEASPTIADTGVRQTAFIMTFSGCITSGDPYDIVNSGTAASTTAVSIPGVTTTVNETLIVNAVANAASPTAPMLRPASIANASLSNVALRKNTQPDGVGGGGVSTNFLRCGPFTSLNPGYGPGNDQTGVKWGVIKRTPTPANIDTMIDLADQHDVLLVINVVGNKPTFRDGSGNVSLALVQDNLDRFVGNAKLTDAFNRRRAVAYVVDEPNVNNEISPTMMNQMAAEHKIRWPGVITMVRILPSLMQRSWGGFPLPPNGYDKIDYGWMQYNNSMARQGLTPAQALASERAVAAQLNIGVAVSHNLWAGGIPTNNDGVLACWNTNGAGGNNGFILGDREANEGTFVACGSLATSPIPSVIASPAWLQHFAEEMAADTEVPFCIWWEDAASGGSSPPFSSYWTRADYVTAQENAIAAGAARTSWVGWRTAK